MFQARSDISAALATIRALNQQISHAEKTLPNLQKLVEVTQQSSTAGSSDILALYTAQNDLTQRSLDILQLKQQLAKARIALEIAAAWHLSP